MHELVIGNKPGIVRHRDTLFDGGFRWLETFDEAYNAGKPYPVSGNRHVLTWADMQEAKIVVAYDALIKAYGTRPHERAASKAAMAKFLAKSKIKHFDDKSDDVIEIGDVMEWRKRAGESGRNAGMRYSVQVLNKRYGQLKSPNLKPELGNFEVRLTIDQATEFATAMLEKVRYLQPSKHPEPALHVLKERIAHAIRLSKPKSGRRSL